MDNEQDEKPLDPAAERVRKRLVRFLAVNLGFLFLAVMIVMGAIVYRTGVFDAAPETRVASPGLNDGAITLPAGAAILSQSLSGDRLSIHVRLATGAEAILIHDLASGEQAARLEIERD